MKHVDKILSIDPSINDTGYSMFHVVRSGYGGQDRKLELIKYGQINNRSKEQYFHRWGFMKKACHELAAELQDGPNDDMLVLVEWPDKIHGNIAKRQSGAPGVLLHAATAGIIADHLSESFDVKMISVSEWIGGLSGFYKKKLNRSLYVLATFPSYNDSMDKGYHACDSIAMALWYLEEFMSPYSHR